MKPKYYTSMPNFLITATVFLVAALLLSLIFNLIFQEKNLTVMVYRLIIFFIGAMIFEFQKRRFAISLSNRILGQSVKQVFTFNNGRSLDIFGNILAISDEKIMICSYYMAIQKKLNFLIQKPLFLKVILMEQVLLYTKSDTQLELILADADKIILTNIPYIDKVQIPLRS